MYVMRELIPFVIFSSRAWFCLVEYWSMLDRTFTKRVVLSLQLAPWKPLTDRVLGDLAQKICCR